MKKIDTILFDLGGVLVEVIGTPAMLKWTNKNLSVDELWDAWLNSSAVRSFEMGRSTADQFADELIEEMDLSVKRNEFIAAFVQWPRRLYPGASRLIERLSQDYSLACLSNTNALHWPRLIDEMGIDKMFSKLFASHLTGKLKPDPESFEHVLNTLNCDASKILFLDDNEINVKGAQELGLIAKRVSGVEEVKEHLERIGILDATDKKYK
jgi:putative hydrolase of the HAD superfamily